MKISKNERNVTNFGYVFATRFHVTHKNFLDDWTNSGKVIASIVFKNGIFKNMKKKIGKNHVNSEKSINSLKIKAEVTWLFTEQFFFDYFLITFRHYYYAKFMFLIFLIWLIFFRFCYHYGTDTYFKYKHLSGCVSVLLWKVFYTLYLLLFLLIYWTYFCHMLTTNIIIILLNVNYYSQYN